MQLSTKITLFSFFVILTFIGSSCSKSEPAVTPEYSNVPESDSAVDADADKTVDAPSNKTETSERITADQVKINQFKNELGADYVTFISEPFVIYSNQTKQAAENYYNKYIKKTYELMFKQFMKIKPSKTLHIFLFKDSKSFKDKVKQIMGYNPDTPYGFFTSAKLALMMNISTGSGTLVHELVHSFAFFDFPDIPLWCNEGIASLFEGYSFFFVNDDGKKVEYLRGHKNWRYPIVWEGYEKNKLPMVVEFIHLDWQDFLNGEKSKYNKAYGRYLFYFLQENGWLENFYKKYRDAYAKNPDAQPVLEAVTGKTVDELDRMFKQWLPNCPSVSSYIPD